MKKILLFIAILTIVAFPQEHRFKGNVKVNKLEATAVDAKKITADSVLALHLVGVDTSYGGLDSIQVYNAIALKANKNSPTFTGTVTLPSTTSIGNVSSTELGYLDNVTGSIQTQINAKASIAQLSDSLALKLNKNFGAALPNNNEIRTDDYLVTYDTQDIQLEATSMADLPVSSATQSALNSKADAGNIETRLSTLENALTLINQSINRMQDTLIVHRYEINALKSIQGAPLPIPPQNFLATASTISKQINLTYNLLGTLDSVIIERRTTGAWTRLVNNGTALNYSDNTINYDVTYWYRAKSYYNNTSSLTYSDSSSALVVTPTYLFTYSTFEFGLIDSVGSGTSGGLQEAIIWSARTQQNGTAWSQGNYTPRNLRSLVNGITANYDSIQVAIKPPQGYATNIDAMSIGLRDGTTFNYSSTPTPITFNGNRYTPTLSTDSSQYTWSDIIPFQIRTGTNYLIHRYKSPTTEYESYITYGSNNSSNATDASLADDITYATVADGRLGSFALIKGIKYIGGGSMNTDTTITFYLANNSGASIYVDSLVLSNANFGISYTKTTVPNGNTFPINVTLNRHKSAGTYTSNINIYHSGTTTYQVASIHVVIIGAGGSGTPTVNPPTNLAALGGLFRIDGSFTSPSGSWDSVTVFNNSTQRMVKVNYPTTTFAITGLPHNTSYTLTAKAYLGGQASITSNSVAVRTTDTTTSVRVLNFYVSNSGNDANNGTSPQTPWRTISKVNSTDFNTASGTVYIGLKRGDIWREELNPTDAGTSENNRIVLTCYGSGALPILTGASDLRGSSTADWTNYSGNIWQRSVTTSIDNYHYLLFEKVGDVMHWGYTKGSTITDVNEEYGFAINGGYLYVYATSNPYTYFNKIERTGRATVNINMDRAYWTLDSLDIYGSGETNLRSTGSYLTFNGCSIHHTGNGSVPEGGSGYGLYPTSQYFTLQHSKIWEVGGHGIYVGAWNSLRNNNAVIQNNIFANNTYTHIDIQTSATTAFQVGGFIIRNNYFIADSSAQVVRYNNSGAGIQVLGSRDGMARITNVKIYNNIIIGQNWGAINWHRNADTIEVYNNTFVNNGSYLMRETNEDGGPYTGPVHLFFRNNVLYSNNGGTMIEMSNDTNKVYSNNLYITSATSPFRYRNSSGSMVSASWSTWSNTSLWLNDNGSYPDGDANSIFSSTSTNIFTTFTSHTAVKNLKPYPGGTLATMVGYDLSNKFITDFYGNPRTGTWRVGAILP